VKWATRAGSNSGRSETRDVVAFGEATRAWFGISLRTFGGPAGQISVMHRELVDERRWIGEQRFLHALSYCTLLPGPEAQQLAIYLGWLLNGTAGGLVAGILFVLPGYIALMILAAIYAQWGATTAVTAIFAGLAPAVLAIVSQAVWRIGKRSLKNRLLIGIAAAAFVALFVFNIAFPIVIAAAGLAGYLAGRSRPDLFVTKPEDRADTMSTHTTTATPSCSATATKFSTSPEPMTSTPPATRPGCYLNTGEADDWHTAWARRRPPRLRHRRSAPRHARVRGSRPVRQPDAGRPKHLIPTTR
jgi:chromate transport protein ChrA